MLNEPWHEGYQVDDGSEWHQEFESCLINGETFVALVLMNGQKSQQVFHRENTRWHSLQLSEIWFELPLGVFVSLNDKANHIENNEKANEVSENPWIPRQWPCTPPAPELMYFKAWTTLYPVIPSRNSFANHLKKLDTLQAGYYQNIEACL